MAKKKTPPTPRDGDEGRRARVRAQASSLVDAKPKERYTSGGRSKASTKRRRGERRRRLGGATVAAGGPTLASLVALLILAVGTAVLFVSPAFKVTRVEVAATGLMSGSTFASRLDSQVVGKSIFLVDGNALHTSTLSNPWVLASTVSLSLPSNVQVIIVERVPELRVSLGSGTDEVVSNDGVTLPVSTSMYTLQAGIPTVVDDRTGSQAATFSTQDVGTITELAASFPTTTGCSVTSFNWSSAGVFSAMTSCHWSAIFGRLNTSQDIAQVPDQMNDLAAARSRLNLQSPNFSYINLEAPGNVIVGGS